MKEFIDLFSPLPLWAKWLMGTSVASLIGLVSHSGRNYLKASEEFRNLVYTKLEGVYPNTASYLSIEQKDIITQSSISPINTAGAKFCHHMPFWCAPFFKKELSHYCNTARKTNWDEQSARDRFDKTKFDGPNPRDEFNKAVRALLKFAK